MSEEKKEKVIHTRVPAALDDELRRHARSLGVSVSNLVRNALNHAFGLVEDVITDSAEVARSARGEGRAPLAPAAPAPPGVAPAEPQILGWQPLFLNLNAVCARCNEVLLKGVEAAIAVTDRPTSRRPILCLSCVKELSHDEPGLAPGDPDA